MAILIALTAGCGAATTGSSTPQGQDCTLVVHLANQLPDSWRVDSVKLSIGGVEVVKAQASTFEGEIQPVVHSGESRPLHEGHHVAAMVEIAVTVTLSDDDDNVSVLDGSVTMELAPRRVGVLITLDPDDQSTASITIERVALPDLLEKQSMCVEEPIEQQPDCDE